MVGAWEKSKVDVEGETSGGALVPKRLGFEAGACMCGEDMVKIELSVGFVVPAAANDACVGLGVIGARTASRIPSMLAVPAGGAVIFRTKLIPALVSGFVFILPVSDPSLETLVELSG